MVGSSTLVTETRSSLDSVRRQLISHQGEAGHWTGQLSSSSLSTATAISALAAVQQHAGSSSQAEHLPALEMIQQGMQYLRGQQNPEGGFGDTDRSHSNIATSYLVKAASALAMQSGVDGLEPESLRRLDGYIDASGGIGGLRRRYGTDKTFVVPILTNLAVAGLFPWKDVPALPFEVAALPQRMYRIARVPVVSYAIPALVAIGQAKHARSPSRFWPLRCLRSLVVERTLGVLKRMQPCSGGYLEATPLTSFVMMSLAASGQGDHPVCQRGSEFLKSSMRSDGSWPIDTNLATWVTSLSVSALSADPNDRVSDDPDSDGPDSEDPEQWCHHELLDWLLSCQHQQRHPFTGADPGGWGWSDLSGAVPDADDTPAAILALRILRRRNPDPATQHRINQAIKQGQRWLVGLQNRDGGIPTFCRGWGKLPFDRSSTDLTAHAIRAWSVGGDDAATDSFSSARQSAIKFLIRNQRRDGSWLPLWFGNQDRSDEDNPVYGTSKVLMAIAQPPARASAADQQLAIAADKGVEYLMKHQNPDGGWGGGPSVGPTYASSVSPEFGGDCADITSTMEETALAVEALIHSVSRHLPQHGVSDAASQAIIRGIRFLNQAVRNRLVEVPWPIGFYFAKLWYHEQLYPLIYTASALGLFLAKSDQLNLSQRTDTQH